MSDIDELKMKCNQLAVEASINRINVSKACEELIKYCMAHQNEDFLLNSANYDNPFREIILAESNAFHLP